MLLLSKTRENEKPNKTLVPTTQKPFSKKIVGFIQPWSQNMADDPLLAEPKSRFKLRNPIKAYYADKARKRILLENEMLRREELMKEDLERFLMQLQEQHSWVTLHLPRINYQVSFLVCDSSHAVTLIPIEYGSSRSTS